MSALGRAAVVTAAAGAATVAWASLIERNLFTLRQYDMPVLPAGSAPVRVLHISDLHLAPWQHRKQDWVRSLASLRPDLVINTGDSLGHSRGLQGVEYALAPLAGTPGVFVHGSNDYFAPQFKNPLRYITGPSKVPHAPARLDTAAMERFFTDRLGWQNLNNTAVGLELKGTRLELLGVDDPHRHLDRLDTLAGKVDELRAGGAGSDAAGVVVGEYEGGVSHRATVTVGVSHAPYQRVLNSFLTYGATAIFAGHTHGGQVCVPGFGALVTNCDLPRDQASGLSLWRHGLSAAYLHVSAGIGTSIYAPVRLACRPEAALVTLTPAAR